MTIKIPVAAEFDATQVEAQLQRFRQQINVLGQQIAAANKIEFSPIDPRSIDDLRKLNQQFETLRRVSGDLNRRMNATGQRGAGFFEIDWHRMYPDPTSRARHMRKMFEYVTGAGFREPVHPERREPSSRPVAYRPRPAATPGIAGMATQVVGAGLNSAGPIGSVGAGALGTGMASGFGAGLMGLFGGLLALGVSKAVGAVMENVGKAERNQVSYDTLKRTLGDVNVSFRGLQAIIEKNADSLGITYEESARLGTQFAKLGNLSGDKTGDLVQEIDTGVGVSRAFGLDPSQGVGALGMVRGVGLTRTWQETRRFALLIGETIGRSKAFAKADEVFTAITDFAVQQTRNSVGAANVAAYAGMFSAMVGSGMPGLDPAGASALLNRVNASLSAGGAHGEASQFFSARVGQRLGIDDPFRLRILREGGAFATMDEAFGPGSAAGRFGIAAPGGGQTWLGASLETLRSSYSDRGTLAMATANHLGINMRQAMALLSIDPNRIGELQNGVDLSTLNARGIGNYAKARYGSLDELTALRAEYEARDGDDRLSDDERQTLARAFGEGGSEAEQRNVLAALARERDQERTQGSDIRDSKNLLDNIKTSLASRLIPLTNEIRMGIVHIAGGGRRSSEEIMADVISIDSEARLARKTAPKNKRLEEIGKELETVQTGIRAEMRFRTDPTGDKMAGLTQRERELLGEQERLRQEIRQMQKDEERARQEQVDQLRTVHELPETTGTGVRGGVPVQAVLPTAGAGGAYDPLNNTATEVADPLLRALEIQESNGTHLGSDGKLLRSPAGALGAFQVMPGTGEKPGFGVKPVQNDTYDEHKRFARDYLAALIRYYKGDKKKALAAYNAGAGAVNNRVRLYGDRWLSHMPDETRDYVPSIMTREARYTPLPADAQGIEAAAQKIQDAASRISVSVTAAPIDLIHRNERGDRLGPTSQHPLLTRVTPPTPHGAR